MRTSTTTSAIADSVGALLKQAREESGLSRSAVALRSKIPERYISLFEDDSTGAMQEDVYVKIYLKAYGKFLGFEANTLLDLYKKEKARFAPPDTTQRKVRTPSRSTAQRRHPSKSVPESALYVTPKLIQTGLLGLALIGFGLYFGLQIKKLVAPPEITLVSPVDGLVTQDRSLVVEGRTEAEVAVRINGKQVSPDADGKFKDALDLQEGLNLITVTGSKKHSKNMTVTRRIIVMPKDRTAVAPAQAEQEETDESLKAAAATEDGTVAGATDTAPVTKPVQAKPPAASAPVETAPAPDQAPVTEPTPAQEPSAVETQPQTQPEAQPQPQTEPEINF